MKVAVVHEWLTTFAGSEKALEQILRLFPGADLFCVVDFLPKPYRGFLQGHRIRPTFIQKLPLARKKYRHYLPLMPVAVRMLDLTGYDLVVSSSHAVANGVKTRSNQLHISYIYSPMRYAWDLRDQYLKESGLDTGLKGFIARAALSLLRRWDYRVAQRVNHFICISEFIRERVKRAYGRESTVVYPPVDTEFFVPGERSADFYLAASRLVPYKMMPLIVSAFSEMPDKKLVVIGDGPEMGRVRACARENIEILGYREDAVLRDYLQAAKALVFAAEEDFGILPVEALACGTPVIGYGAGGLLETVDGLDETSPTGVLFDEQSPESIKKAVEQFEQNAARIRPEICRAKALRFSEKNFRKNFENTINEILRAESATNRAVKP